MDVDDKSHVDNTSDVEVEEIPDVEIQSQVLSNDSDEKIVSEQESIDEKIDETFSVNDELDDVKVESPVDEKSEDDFEDPGAEVWESDEETSPEDNAEVWENEDDYSDESQNTVSRKITDKFKSLLRSDEDEEAEKDKTSFFSSLKFAKDITDDSDLEEDASEITDEVKKELNDDVVIDDVEPEMPNPKDNSDIDDVELEMNDPKDNIKFGSTVDLSSDEELVEEVPEPKPQEKTVKRPTKKTQEKVTADDKLDLDFDDAHNDISNNETADDKVDLGSDEDYIIVDHSHDEEPSHADKGNDDNSGEEIIGDDRVDLGSDDDYIYVDHSHDEEHVMDDEPDKVNIEDFAYKEEYVADDEPDEVHSEEPVEEVQEPPRQRPKSRRTNFVKSIIADVVNGESQLEQKEIETVKGEIMEEDEVPIHKPAPRDDSVVEAEIIFDGEELNVLNDDFSDLNKDEVPLERPAPKMDYTEGEELNIFTDELPDLHNDDVHDEAVDIVGRAMEEFLDDVFDNEDLRNEPAGESMFKNDDNNEISHDKVTRDELFESNNSYDEEPHDGVVSDDLFESRHSENESETEKPQVNEVIIEENNPAREEVRKEPDEDIGDGVTYYQGSNDVRSKLRKNNFYYDDEKPKSVRDSIKGIKKDMEYINKSLKEIENPTHIDYVSVVDRTEEYDPNDYLSRPNDDDSDKIIEKEEELTFAEKEEQRIEKEMMMDALEKEISSDEDVIVPVHEQFRREELKDQALEDIILSANEDYKEIEKERHMKNNQLKAFDDKKLPGKGNMEDEIISYVQIDDIGLHSSDELYKQPIEKVAKSVKDIVDIEGPIHVKEVTKRIKDSCNIKRAGSNLKKRVNAAIGEAEKSGDIIKIGDFLYDASNNNIIIRKRNKPNIDLISDEEIAKNIETVLLHKSDVTTSQIAKETSRNFGFKSTSKKTATRINSVLDLMIANNKVKIDNDIVELK